MQLVFKAVFSMIFQIFQRFLFWNFGDFWYVFSLVRENVDFVKMFVFSWENWYFWGFAGFETLKKITNTSRDPHPFFFSRVARRIFFEVPLSREAQRNCFCLSARSAEKIFYLFARSAEKIFWGTSFARSAEKFFLLIRAKRGEKFLLIRAKRGENFLKYLFRAKRRENFFAYPREARRKFFTYSREARRKFLFRSEPWALLGLPPGPFFRA